MSAGTLILSGLRYLRDFWRGADSMSPESLDDQSESGAALVEFTILMPLLFLILFGIIEFGAMIWLQNNMTNAAREGARAYAVQGLSPTQNACKFLSGAGQTFTISATDLCTTSGGTQPDIQVTVSIPKSSASLMNTFFLFSNGVLTASQWSGTVGSQVTMRKENNCATTIAATSCLCNTSGATPTGC